MRRRADQHIRAHTASAAAAPASVVGSAVAAVGRALFLPPFFPRSEDDSGGGLIPRAHAPTRLLSTPRHGPSGTSEGSKGHRGAEEVSLGEPLSLCLPAVFAFPPLAARPTAAPPPWAVGCGPRAMGLELEARVAGNPVIFAGRTLHCSVRLCNTAAAAAAGEGEGEGGGDGGGGRGQGRAAGGAETLAWASAQVHCQSSFNRARVSLPRSAPHAASPPAAAAAVAAAATGARRGDEFAFTPTKGAPGRERAGEGGGREREGVKETVVFNLCSSSDSLSFSSSPSPSPSPAQEPAYRASVTSTLRPSPAPLLLHTMAVRLTAAAPVSFPTH